MYKIASLFAGVGGIDLGFEQTGHFKTVWANEYDDKARETFRCNFSNKSNSLLIFPLTLSIKYSFTSAKTFSFCGLVVCSIFCCFL